MKSTVLRFHVALALFAGNFNSAAAAEPLNVVVMDPMAAPLACDCVQGYAQRKYEKLGEYLEEPLNRKVNVYWSGSLPAALKEHSITADLVIGKHSVVLSDAKLASIKLKPIAQLSNLDGSLTQTGLIVVRQNDKAQSVADLKSYRILFGPQDCDEKNLAPINLLKQNGIPIPGPQETSEACSTAAAKLLELPKNVKAAAVISSYAAPLLEGCGTVKKGDLRVIGTSEPVPFITAFANSNMDLQQITALQSALLDVELNPELLIALETVSGFVAWKDPKSVNSGKSPEVVSKKKI